MVSDKRFTGLLELMYTIKFYNKKTNMRYIFLIFTIYQNYTLALRKTYRQNSEERQHNIPLCASELQLENVQICTFAKVQFLHRKSMISNYFMCIITTHITSNLEIPCLNFIGGGGGGEQQPPSASSTPVVGLKRALQSYTGWPRKNATTLIVNFKDIINKTELIFIL